MSDPIPFPEDYEMGMEAYLGHPFPGKPEERIAALTRRVTYLQGQKIKCLDLLAEGKPDAEELLDGANKDLAEAQKQLTEWKLQHGGRN